MEVVPLCCHNTHENHFEFKAPAAATGVAGGFKQRAKYDVICLEFVYPFAYLLEFADFEITVFQSSHIHKLVSLGDCGGFLPAALLELLFPSLDSSKHGKSFWPN